MKVSAKYAQEHLPDLLTAASSGKKHLANHKPNPLGICYPSLVPTVLRIDRLSVVIYPNDHRPAHVHIKGAENEALFYLACPGGPASLRDNYGFSLATLRKIEAALNARLSVLCAAWKEMHDLY